MNEEILRSSVTMVGEEDRLVNPRLSAGPCNLTGSSSIADRAYDSACDLFRQQLSEKDEARFIQYPSANLMISEIHQAAKSHPIHSARITKCAENLTRFTMKLSKFHEVVTTFVRASPAYVGFLWGSLCLVFQVRTIPYL